MRAARSDLGFGQISRRRPSQLGHTHRYGIRSESRKPHHYAPSRHVHHVPCAAVHTPLDIIPPSINCIMSRSTATQWYHRLPSGALLTFSIRLAIPSSRAAALAVTAYAMEDVLHLRLSPIFGTGSFVLFCLVQKPILVTPRLGLPESLDKRLHDGSHLAGATARKLHREELDVRGALSAVWLLRALVSPLLGRWAAADSALAR